jgi:hypothetical protein
MRRIPVLLLCVGLAGCVSSSGDRSESFINPQVAASYIPLAASEYVVMEARGAAFAIAPGIAVTNAHNANTIPPGSLIGVSKNYDLLFFRTDKQDGATFSEPSTGEKIISYGQGVSGEVREAHGAILELEVPVEPRCAGCVVQKAFVYDAKAGPGFSGGPVVDAENGEIVGITFGYLDPNSRRVMYAYSISRVKLEYKEITGQPLPGGPEK